MAKVYTLDEIRKLLEMYLLTLDDSVVYSISETTYGFAGTGATYFIDWIEDRETFNAN